MMSESGKTQRQPGNPELERLFELASILNQQQDFQEILRVVAEKTTSWLESEAVIIMMINPATRDTLKTFFKEGPDSDRRQYQDVQMQVSGWMIKHQHPFKSADVGADTRFARKMFKGLSFPSVLGVPLRTAGTVIGTLLLIKRATDGKVLERELSFLEQIATISAPYLRNVHNIQQYFETPVPIANLRARYEAMGLKGKSKQFLDLLHAIDAAARCDVRVLLEGASGTGKELVARAIHQFSARASKPLVTVDCGAIAVSLIESELFGHVKGAFTGAATDRKGLFEEASGGTLFMDEIAAIPLDVQSKLMRVLQEGEVRPLGSNKTRNVDVRVISAASISLRKLVDQQQFREDLFFRLHVYPIHVPSLSERQDDIPLLASHFLIKFASEQHKKVEAFDGEILDFMKVRAWSGNIRELENFVERLVTLAPLKSTVLSRNILPKDLRSELRKLSVSLQDLHVSKSLNETLADYEEQLIRQTLAENSWNQSRTARILKISEQTLRYKMGKLGIVRP